MTRESQDLLQHIFDQRIRWPLGPSAYRFQHPTIQLKTVVVVSFIEIERGLARGALHGSSTRDASEILIATTGVLLLQAYGRYGRYDNACADITRKEKKLLHGLAKTERNRYL